jgi:hypothetical protein
MSEGEEGIVPEEKVERGEVLVGLIGEGGKWRLEIDDPRASVGEGIAEVGVDGFCTRRRSGGGARRPGGEK